MGTSRMNDKPYYQVDHYHCWAQGGAPACGINLENHTKCCLCELPKEKECCPKCRIKLKEGGFVCGGAKFFNLGDCECHHPKQSWEEGLKEQKALICGCTMEVCPFVEAIKSFIRQTHNDLARDAWRAGYLAGQQKKEPSTAYGEFLSSHKLSKIN